MSTLEQADVVEVGMHFLRPRGIPDLASPDSRVCPSCSETAAMDRQAL